MESKAREDDSGGGGSSDGGGEGVSGPYYLFWREKCDRLETQNRILQATNKHLVTLLRNATAENDSLKGLVAELESCYQTSGLVPNFRDLKEVKEQDRVEDLGPLSVLPEEIWETVLNQLKDSKDIQNFCRAFPNWDKILHRTKQSWLFDQVFPSLFSYLSREDTLQCRLTCTRWLSAVDDFLENNESRRPTPRDHPGPVIRLRALTTWLARNGFVSSDITPVKADTLIQQAKTHSRNPLMGRQATLKFEPDCPHANTFLSHFGRHIWYLKIESHQHGASWLFWRLVEILPLVPNVKKLEISIHPVTAPSAMVPSYMQTLEEQWKQNHLPPLPHLESLEITEHDLFHGCILKNVLLSTYSSQICRLGVNQYCIPVTSNLSTLTQLTLSADTDLQVESLVRLQSPIIRLTLYLNYNDHDVTQDYPSIPLVFQAIHNFKNSLRALYIQFPNPRSSINWSRLNQVLPTLHLPHLTTLGMQEFTPLTFNLVARLGPSLQYLHLYAYRVREGISPIEQGSGIFHRPNELEILDIHWRLQNRAPHGLHDSNAWTLLPKLREITVSLENGVERGERTFCREMYHKFAMTNCIRYDKRNRRSPDESEPGDRILRCTL